MRRNPQLDGVRGVAILLVFAYHLAPKRVTGGFIGVDLFFVLSGFLITSILIAEHREHGRLDLARFYFRRALRLLPTLWVALALTAITVAIVAQDQLPLMWTFGVTSVLNVSNFTVAGGHPTWAVFTWSLSAEEQFYLLWPPLLALLIGRVKPRVLLIGLVSLAAVSAAIRYGYEIHQHEHITAYYHPFAHSDGLLAGCALAFAKIPRLRGAVFALVAIALTATLTTYWMYPWGYVVVILAAAALVQDAAEERLKWAQNVVLRFFGEISYALYIVSGILLGFFSGAGLVLGALVCTAAATGFTYLLERPLRRRQRKRTAVGAAVVAPAAAQ